MSDLVKQENVPSYLQAYKGDLGIGQEMTVNDVGITYLSLMQSGSKLVKSKIVPDGSFVLTATKTVVGDEKNPVEFIVLGRKNFWVVKNGLKYVDKFPAVHSKEYPKENKDGTKNWYTIEMYVLLPARMAVGDISPYVYTFRSSSLKKFNAVAAALKVAVTNKIPSHSIVFNMTSVLETYEDNSFFVPNITQSRYATPAEFDIVAQAYDAFKNATIKVSEEEEENF